MIYSGCSDVLTHRGPPFISCALYSHSTILALDVIEVKYF